MIHRTIDAIRAWRAGCEGTVGLVPTMGDLHQGHLSLMRLAAQRCDHVVASVFVNPAQFGPGEDFEDYPRALDADARACQEVGVEAIFAPSDDEIYAPDHLTVVTVPQMTDHLCGAHRPGHFDGVATIVTKLFHITSPDVAVFGQKDYQQLAMIRRMARDLNFPVEILGGATVREPDGLAMSSRNRYLEGEQRQQARALSRGLAAAWRAWHDGEREVEALLTRARRPAARLEGPEIDYVEAVDPGSLEPLEGRVEPGRGCVIALAVQVGQARLIDNLRLDGPLPAELEESEDEDDHDEM